MGLDLLDCLNQRIHYHLACHLGMKFEYARGADFQNDSNQNRNILGLRTRVRNMEGLGKGGRSSQSGHGTSRRPQAAILRCHGFERNT